nr:calcium independent phospholipase A2 VIA [Hymenolepis microstoma]
MEEMSRLGTFVTNIVKTALYTIQPNKVEEYPYEQYAVDFYLFERVQELYHSFIFYKIANYYDMIYIPPAPSLDTPSRERRVFRFAEIFHELTKICAVHDVKIDKAWLEKVTSMCRRNPKWNLAHFAAAINFAEAFQHHQIAVHVNEVDEDTGETPLQVAVKAESTKTVQALLNIPKIKLGVCDHAGNTVLHMAVGLSSLELLQILLDINPTQEQESTAPITSTIPLCKQVGFKNSDRLDINAINLAGETCLYLAIHNTVVSEAIVSLLLQAGANPKIGTTDSMPIHLAVKKNLICCVDLMYSYYPDVINLQTRYKKLSTLHFAKKKPMFNHLLELGADPNLRNSEGRTVLHQAVERQELDTVVQLLIHAADTNLADNRGIYPLHLAVAKCLDVHIVYALIVFEANVNATDVEGLSPRHWLCHHESGIYQRSSMRDKILYALNSSLCVTKTINIHWGSFSYLTQLLQDTPFASALCRSTDDLTVAELFNGTPPDPVLSNTNLTQDLDNDLFLYLAGRGSPSSLSSRCASPRKRSAPEARPSRGFDSSIMSTVREEVDLESQDSSSCLADIESPPPETVEFPVDTGQNNQPEEGERCASPTIVQKTTDSWFRRTVLSRFLSTVMPGLDSLMMADEPTVPIIEGVEEEEKRMNNGCLESDPSSADTLLAPPSVNISNPMSADIPESQDEQDIPQQEDQHYESTDTFHTVENQNLSDGDHGHRWSRSIDGCSGLPGVPCCLDRNALSLAAQHEVVNGIAHTSLPTANLKNLCEPSVTSSSKCSSLNSLQRDPEGFRFGRRGYRVLCLDGGGIRGLVLCQVLRAIERAAGRPIRDLYDWIIGTSTGAMLALNLVQGKCVRYNRCLYFRMKEKIFVGNRPYPTEGLESLLREEFGETPVMTDIKDVRKGPVKFLLSTHIGFRCVNMDRILRLADSLLGMASDAPPSPSSSPSHSDTPDELAVSSKFSF